MTGAERAVLGYLWFVFILALTAPVWVPCVS